MVSRTRGRLRRRLQWARTTFSSQSVPVLSDIRYDLLAAIRVDMDITNSTVRRIIGRFNLLAATGTSVFAMAIKTTGPRVTVAEVARPSEERHSDWMWWWFGDVESQTNSTLNAPVLIDNRSQRRLREAEGTLSFIVQNLDAGDSVTFNGYLSVLLALP